MNIFFNYCCRCRCRVASTSSSLWFGIRSDPARCRGRAALRGSRRLHGDEADHPDIATTLHALGGDPVAPARPPGDVAGCAPRWRGASSSGLARCRGRPPGHRHDIACPGAPPECPSRFSGCRGSGAARPRHLARSRDAHMVGRICDTYMITTIVM